MNEFCINIFFIIIITSLVIQIIFPVGTEGIDVRISSSYKNVHVSSSTRLVQVIPATCTSDESIRHCQFRVDHQEIFDLSKGNDTKRTKMFSYYGKGLDKGDCGIILNGGLFLTEGGHVIECRVRNDDDCDWMYASLAIFSTASNELAMNTSNRKVVAALGSNVNLSFKFTNPDLTECFFKVNRLGEWMMLNDTMSSTSADFKYFGQGIQSGECGVTIHNVTEDENGLVWFKIRSKSKKSVIKEGIDFIHLIIAKAPETPVLTVNLTTTGNRYILHASCLITGSRPAASIRWYFGDVVKSEKYNTFTCVTDDGWTEPYGNQTTKKFLTRKLGPVASLWINKQVWCEVRNDVNATPVLSKKMNLKQILAKKLLYDEEDLDKETSWTDTNTLLVVVIILLIIIIIGVGVAVLIFAHYRGLCCFSPQHMDEAPVINRQVTSPSTTNEEKSSTFKHRAREPIVHMSVSSIDDVYVTSANEYAEIRESIIIVGRNDKVFAPAGEESPESEYSECTLYNYKLQE